MPTHKEIVMWQQQEKEQLKQQAERSKEGPGLLTLLCVDCFSSFFRQLRKKNNRRRENHVLHVQQQPSYYINQPYQLRQQPTQPPRPPQRVENKTFKTIPEGQNILRQTQKQILNLFESQTKKDYLKKRNFDSYERQKKEVYNLVDGFKKSQNMPSKTKQQNIMDLYISLYKLQMKTLQILKQQNQQYTQSPQFQQALKDGNILTQKVQLFTLENQIISQKTMISELRLKFRAQGREEQINKSLKHHQEQEFKDQQLCSKIKTGPLKQQTKLQKLINIRDYQLIRAQNIVKDLQLKIKG